MLKVAPNDPDSGLCENMQRRLLLWAFHERKDRKEISPEALVEGPDKQPDTGSDCSRFVESLRGAFHETPLPIHFADFRTTRMPRRRRFALPRETRLASMPLGSKPIKYFDSRNSALWVTIHFGKA